MAKEKKVPYTKEFKEEAVRLTVNSDKNGLGSAGRVAFSSLTRY